ncbi:hypothetical protein MMC26_002215 [Xylographa opegraphella]|nr:hypothetical protein [Xylographa opegraphella]
MEIPCHSPILLDNDQPVDIPDAASPDDQKPTLEVPDPAPHSGPSPTLSGEFAEPRHQDGKDAPDSLAKYNTNDPAGDEKAGNNKSEDDSAIRTDAPASVGQIHDVFAEFEETFGLTRRKQKTMVATLRDCPYRDVTTGSIPRPVSQGEPRSAADDGAADMELLAETVSGDVGRNSLSEEEIENRSTFQSRQESDGQETQTEDVRSQCISTLAGDCHSESASAFTGPRPSPPPIATYEATRPEPGADTQEAPNRKQTRPLTQSIVPYDDGAPCKRPRRATKETWKAREAREAREKFEAKRSQTLLNPYRKKQTPSVGHYSGRGKVVSKVADIEDVYLGEGGSVQ